MDFIEEFIEEFMAFLPDPRQIACRRDDDERLL
jgi:hypothetical protein